MKEEDRLVLGMFFSGVLNGYLLSLVLERLILWAAIGVLIFVMYFIIFGFKSKENENE